MQAFVVNQVDIENDNISQWIIFWVEHVEYSKWEKSFIILLIPLTIYRTVEYNFELCNKYKSAVLEQLGTWGLW